MKNCSLSGYEADPHDPDVLIAPREPVSCRPATETDPPSGMFAGVPLTLLLAAAAVSAAIALRCRRPRRRGADR